jgi:hypothetical protein
LYVALLFLLLTKLLLTQQDNKQTDPQLSHKPQSMIAEYVPPTQSNMTYLTVSGFEIWFTA